MHRNPFPPLFYPSSPAPFRPFLILCKLYYFHCLFTGLPILFPSAQDLRRLSGFCRVSPSLHGTRNAVYHNELSRQPSSPVLLHHLYSSCRENRSRANRGRIEEEERNGKKITNDCVSLISSLPLITLYYATMDKLYSLGSRPRDGIMQISLVHSTE